MKGHNGQHGRHHLQDSGAPNGEDCHLVVVDEDGQLAGVFSMRDLVVGLLQERAELAAAQA